MPLIKPRYVTLKNQAIGGGDYILQIINFWNFLLRNTLTEAVFYAAAKEFRYLDGRTVAPQVSLTRITIKRVDAIILYSFAGS